MSKLKITIIVVAVIGGGVWLLNNDSVNPLSYMTSPTPTSTPTPSPAKVTGINSVKKTAMPVPTSALSYTQLVEQYGTNRIQFDQDCNATPKSAVFKNGTRILLDNRSNQARTISVSGSNYSLVAYGYRVVTLSSPSVPMTLNINCNTKFNVGTIQLQANISGQ